MANSTTQPVVESLQYRLGNLVSFWIQPGLVTYVMLVALLLPLAPSISQFILWYAVAATGLITLPIIYVLWLLRRNRISHFFLPVRQQRTSVYLFTIASCLLGFFVLVLVHAPPLLSAFTLMMAVNTIVMSLINLYWKISGHTAGLIAPLITLTFQYGSATFALYLLVPLVVWARIVVRAHTPAQAVTGALLGGLLAWVQLLIYLPLLSQYT